MSKIIVYGSYYGTARRYAEALSEKTGIPALAYTEVSGLSAYDTVLYLGALYAGGVLGLADTLKRYPITPEQTLIIVTVGLADPGDETNTNSIKRSLSKQIPKELFDKSRVFHLRGGIDYNGLNFKHKAMMMLLYNKTKNLPPERRGAETEAFIDTYNKRVDFVELDSLNEIIKEL